MKSFKQEFIAKTKNINPNSCCSYGFVRGDGVRIYQINDVCFARLASNCGIKLIRFHINQFPNNPEKNARIKKHVDYVVKELYPKAFLNKSSNYYKEGLSLNTNLSHTAIFYVMTLIRMSWERYKTYIPNVDLLESLGFEPFHAMVVAQYFLKYNEDYINSTFYGHHGVTPEDLRIKAIRKISLDIFKEQSKSSMNANGFKLFDTIRKINIGETIYEHLSKYEESKGTGWDRTLVISDINKALIDLKEKLYA